MNDIRNIDISIIERIREICSQDAYFYDVVVLDSYPSETSQVAVERIVSVDFVSEINLNDLELSNNDSVFLATFRIDILTESMGDLKDLMDLLLSKLYGNLDIYDYSVYAVPVFLYSVKLDNFRLATDEKMRLLNGNSYMHDTITFSVERV